jgi:hypothetical protein
MLGSCKYGDETAGSGAMEFVSLTEEIFEQAKYLDRK